MTVRSRSRTDESIVGRYNAGVACADAPATMFGERTAILHEDGGTVTALSFRELARQSSALAAALSDASGAVGVYAPAGALAAIAHIAVLKAGAISVPLVPLLGDDAIRHRVKDAEIEVLLVAPELEASARALLTDADVTILALDDELLKHGARPPVPAVAPTTADDPALILYTSGTTGRPKGAVLGHRVILARHAPLSMIHGPFAPDDVFWTPADWMWVGSIVDAVLAPLAAGCTVFTYARTRFEPSAAVVRLKHFGVTRAFIPPTALRQLMDVPRAEWNGHKLRSVHSGGEPLTADAVHWAEDTLKIVIDEIYGMTEASFVIGNAHRYNPPQLGSMGRPFPGQTVRVVDAEGRPSADGELQIAVSSPSLFLGYYGQPEATAARIRDGWFATGDLVSRDDDGRLYYVGRSDDLIMSSGHRIGPGEIEDVLRSHCDVREAVVVGEPDAERGQRVKAVVQLHNGNQPPDALTGELQDLVRARVGRHAYPRAVEYVAEFPRTVTGKVRRDLLRLTPSERV